MSPTSIIEATSFHNRGRGAFNAWFFDRCGGYVNFITRSHKRSAFAGMRTGDVVEIGAGTGANFGYIPAGSTVHAVEPNVAMHRRLGRRASRRGIELRLLATSGEAIPLCDSSVDEVIATLVLCTVDDPALVLAEIKRILRPGGSFRFVEHVVASGRSPRRWIQRSIRRPWAWVFEGCDLCRDTATAVENAGFETVEIGSRRFRQSGFVPANSAIWGIATKAADGQPDV